MVRMFVHGGYEIDPDPERVDVDALCAFLDAEAYWARWRTRDDVRHQVSTAWRVVGVYTERSEMVGFARAVSDGRDIAYLADVYVLSDHRGQGLGRALLREMIENGPGAMFRWMLHTRDAHGLYRGFGFAEPDERFMERPSSRTMA
jgi:GNAT superfamily N-acetyltransferase